MEWFTCYKLRKVLPFVTRSTNFISRYRIVPLHTADDFEPLRHLAGISQHRFIECNADDKNPITQISLPSTVAETVCLQAPVVDDSVSLNLMPLVQTGEWAISALNRDRYFEEREKRRAVSLPEEYQNFQLTRMAIGR